MPAAGKGERKLTFEAREFKGSRYRCLLATSLPQPKFVEWMNSLIQPFAEINENSQYAPRGFPHPAEVKLGETSGYLDPDDQRAVTRWWIEVLDGANTPNWDLVATCKIGGRDGLVLVEAKAHETELKDNDNCGAKNKQNRNRISKAIAEASSSLGKGWSLEADNCYQLSNRLAWAWKIASLGKPVVLVYLGFLDAREMPEPFKDGGAWEGKLREYAKGRVPAKAWESRIMVSGTPMIPLIRSADVNVLAS
jgi:hypothetical protein